MDIDLDRSLRLLDNAILSQGRSILRKKPKKRNLDFTADVSLAPEDLEMYEDYQTNTLYNKTIADSLPYDKTFAAIIDENKTLTGTVLKSSETWTATTDSLYMEFFEILQTYSTGNEILNLLADMSRCCSDSLRVLKGLQSKVSGSKALMPDNSWLENERNTWRLLYVLYGNRLNVLENGNGGTEVENYYGRSEKLCMLSLFKRDSLVRESQLVIDWLECNAAQKDDEVLHFSDNSAGWENTLHQLKAKESIVFEASRDIVQHMDPDALHYERKPLHDLDMADEKRICKKIFTEIRCGKLEEAQKICAQSGHYWRSAMLEGWKLYHNPNYKDQFAKQLEDLTDMEKSNLIQTEGGPMRKPIEGNEKRDVWKNLAWSYCEQETLDPFEKAAIAAYSGNLQTLLNICVDWEDYLWAYMRVMIDIKVESELRENVRKKYKSLPDDYWNQKMSINDIFTCLESSKTLNVKREAITPDHLIQKFIILDEIKTLADQIEDWLLESDISTQFLRFLAHLVLFLEQIGQLNNRDLVERVLEEYIKRLVEQKHTQLVAHYVSKLNETLQIHIYANYLARIVDTEERKESLTFAEDSALNIFAITAQIVEIIRGKLDPVETLDLQTKITQKDEYKIGALDWLLFYEDQLTEALRQTNALIFTFLTLNKSDAAQLAFYKLPTDIVKRLLDGGETSVSISQNIREYLSYKAYFEAHDAFNSWFKYFQSKPLEPQKPSDSAAFTEKVAHQHKMSQYKAENERWKLSINELGKSAKNALYNVLLFPDGGWLFGARDGTHLRSICIPECVLLLYRVLYDSNEHAECVQLADIVASEKYQIYKVYTKEKLGELFMKLSESSVALLNENKDPWGNESSA